MEKELIIKELDKCLLTEEEISKGPEVWSEYEDPLPEWQEFE